MIRTIRELIDALEEQAELVGDDAEVRIAHQPNWPLELTIARVVSSEDMARAYDPDDPDCEDQDEPGSEDDEAEPVVWLTEGQQLGYASKRLWQEF